MKSLDDVRQALRDTIAELEGETACVHAALAALNGDVAEPKERKAPKAPRPPKPGPLPFVCAECDREFKSLQAISVHRARSHGYRKAAKLEVVEPVEAVNGVKNPRMALYCTDCDFSTGDLHANAINKHTFDAHRRMSTSGERRPKAAP